MFAVWAAARIAVSIYMQRNVGYADGLLGLITDVEIHSLRFRWGWDLAALVMFAAFAGIFQKLRGRPVILPTIVATSLAAALSIAMVMYPALTLSGRITSPFSGINRSLNESIAFAVVVTLLLMAVIAVLAGTQGKNPPAHPPARA